VKVAVEEPVYVPTSRDIGEPLRLWDEGYVGFPQYSTEDTRELSLLTMIPQLKNSILEKIERGEDWQAAFDAALSDVGAEPGEFEEVRRRVFVALPESLQEFIDY